MEYKFYAAILFALIGSVAGAPVESAALSFEDFNCVMWLHRVLYNEDRWNKLQLPEGAEITDPDFVRGLAVFASTINNFEYSHQWRFDYTYDGVRSEFEQIFDQKITSVCKRVSSRAKDTSVPKPKVPAGKVTNIDIAEKVCDKLLVDPQLYAKQAFKVIEKNNLISDTIRKQ